MRFVNRAWTNSLSFKVILAYVGNNATSIPSGEASRAVEAKTLM